ncbi:lupeol synthase [Salvia divinorum]|uniref:Lupeol synthase n=1 Tax=Salvia divinorum TaxID=28513 RepID=A0ABD1GUS3_SALDI
MWRLKVAEGGGRWLTTSNNHTGRQHWEFDENAVVSGDETARLAKMRHEFSKNRHQIKQSADQLMRMQLRKENPSPPLPTAARLEEEEEITAEATATTLSRDIGYLSTVQARDGHWPAESAAPLFFLPPLVMALYITGDLDAILSSEHKKEMLRYTHNHQVIHLPIYPSQFSNFFKFSFCHFDFFGRIEWGLHVEGHNTMFGSVLNYVVLRLLGEGPKEEAVARGRKWILQHGGAVRMPSWGKFWLTVLGVHEWAGCNPYPPELWLLPTWFPFNAGMMACYARLAYMPMSSLYGERLNLVQTSWALLSLINAGQGEIDLQPIHRGIRLLINSQMEDGDFPQQDIVGVIFKNCSLNYSSYRNIFPIWAIGKYRQHILQAQLF